MLLKENFRYELKITIKLFGKIVRKRTDSKNPDF